MQNPESSAASGSGVPRARRLFSIPLAAPSGKADRILWPVLLVVLGVMLLGGGAQTVERTVQGSSEVRSFVEIARRSLVAPEPGAAPLFYEHEHARFYPPFFWCVYTPIALFPESLGDAWRHALGGSLLYVLQYLAMIVAVVCVLKGLWPDDCPVPRFLLAAVWLLTIPFFFNAMVRCEPDMLVLAPVAAGCFLLSRKRNVHGGFWLGIATALKLTPGLFLIYVIYKRNWHALLGMILAGIVAVGVVPTIAWGLKENYRQHESFVRRVLIPYATDGGHTMLGRPFRSSNQSLSAVMARLLTGEGYGLREHGPAPVLARWSLGPVLNITRAMQVVILLAAAFAIGLRKAPPHPLAPWFEYSLVVIAMLEISFVSWTAHHVTMLLPIATFMTFVVRHRQAWERKLILAALVAWLVLLPLTAVKSLSMLFWGMILFFIVAVIVRWRMRLGLVAADEAVPVRNDG